MAKKIVLGIGIAIIFSAVVHYGICTFFPRPKWNDYTIDNYRDKYNRASATEKIALEKERIRLSDERDLAQERWANRSFYIGLPAGILAIIGGAVIKLTAIGSGLMGGGIIVLMAAYGHYWNNMPDGAKFLTLLAVFMLLIWVGYKKIEKK